MSETSPRPRRNQRFAGLTASDVGVLACIALVVVVLAWVAWLRIAFYFSGGTGTYRVVKTYTVASGTGEEVSTSKRVDLEDRSGERTTMSCNDNMLLGVLDSAAMYAQLDPGRWYSIRYTGYRRTGWISFFPQITEVQPVPEPRDE